MSNYSTQYIFRVIDKFSAPLDKFNKRIKKINIDVKKTSEQMTRLGTSMSMKFGLPLLGAVRNLQMFDRAMMSVKAVSKGTEQQFNDLRKQAIELGKTTQFTATQAGEAQAFLGMAGFDMKKILGAMPSTLNLAASANLDMGRSADIVSNIMSGYRLEANELDDAVNVLAKSFSSSNTDLSMLGEGMKMAGPVAKGFGVQFEETVATLGLLGNNAFQGSLGGTALKRAISELASPTAKSQKILNRLGITTKDATGKLLPLHNILKQMEDTGFSTGDAMQFFGQRAGPAMVSLMGVGSERLKEFTKELEDADGTASNIAKTKMSGLDGAIKLMTSAFDGLNKALGDAGLTDIVLILTGVITWLANSISNLPVPIKITIAVLFGLLGVLGPVLLMLGQIGMGLMLLKPLLGVLSTSTAILTIKTWALNMSLLPLLITLGAIALAIYSVGYAFYYAFTNWDRITAGATIKWNRFKDNLSGAVPQWIKDFYNWLAKIMQKLNEFTGIGDMFSNSFNPSDWGRVLGENTREGIGNLWDSAVSYFGGTSTENKSTVDINVNAQQGALKSASVQGSKGFKPALNIGGGP